METLFIEAKYRGEMNLKRIKLAKLPLKIGLISSVQFADHLPKIRSYLEDNEKKVYIEKGLQANSGQVLGCEHSAAARIGAMVDCFLYIGDGRFHPIGVRLATGKDVFVFDPISDVFDRIEKKDIERIKMKRKAQLIKFHSSNNIGVIVSMKKGQCNLRAAKEILSKYDKNYYYILFDNVDFSQLENFNFIECWINTACPRIEEDIKALNISNIEKL